MVQMACYGTIESVEAEDFSVLCTTVWWHFRRPTAAKEKEESAMSLMMHA